jgi:hypothetical protein
MQNSLNDPQMIAEYHQEYLTLINHYDNFKRPGTFIRYYNINFTESDKHPVVQSTFDTYSSNIKFDIYELTPTYNISPINNSTVNLTEKKGQSYDGVSSITIYTINTPHIHDLVTFYDPVNSGEIYRVSNIRTSINAFYSNPKLKWYEMDLEVAPITDTSSLKISKHYVYDTHKEMYYNYKDYKLKTDAIKMINSKIAQISSYYSRINDLYCADRIVPFISNHTIVPFISNHTINYFKNIASENDNYIRIFDDFKKAYGFIERFPTEVATYDYSQSIYRVYNLSTNEIEEYEWDRHEESPLNTLLTLTRDLQLLIDSNLNYFSYNLATLTLIPPPNSYSAISNISLAVDPGVPPIIYDSYGRKALDAVLIGYVDDPNPVLVNGSRVWTYRYTSVDEKLTVDWSHTYMVIYGAGLTSQAIVIHNNTDTLIQLTKTDMNKVYIIDNANDVRFNLPEEDMSTIDLSMWINIHRIGTGNISIYASNDAKLEDSVINGFIINNDDDQPWANIGLFLAATDLWKFISTPLGTWETH